MTTITRQDYPPVIEPPKVEVQHLSKIVKFEKIKKNDLMKTIPPKSVSSNEDEKDALYNKLVHNYTLILEACSMCGLKEETITMDSLIVNNYRELLALRAIRLKEHNEYLKRQSHITKTFVKMFK